MPSACESPCALSWGCEVVEILSLVGRVLREPNAVVDEGDSPERLAELIPRLLVIAAVGAALFGVVVGSYRGGIQVAYAAVKMPFLLLIPVLLTLPAARALWAACDLEVPWRRVAVAGAVAMARAGVLAAGLGPVLWLVYSMQPGYHLSVLILAGALVTAGLPGLSVLARAVPSGGARRWVAVMGSVLALGLCTMQTGWVLRPFVARPTVDVTFLRPVEEDIFSGLRATSRSATGNYETEWDVESKGLLRRRDR